MATMTRTEEREVTTLADIPVAELAKHCDDPAMLATVVSLAYNLGYRLGQRTAHEHYNRIFKGGDEQWQ